jgi:predicted permease
MPESPRGCFTMDALWQDLRQGIRALRRGPGFAIVAVLAIALGIGAGTAIFSVVNSVLLRPLAYRQPQQLYLIREIIPQLAKFYPSFPANLPNFRTWQKECQSFDQIAIVQATSMNLTGQGSAEQIYGGQASANLFDLLGVQPATGRTFFPREDEPGQDHVVMLTDSFWRNRFHADRSLVGKAIVLNGSPYEVVGILPSSFRFPKELGALVELGPRLDFFKPLGLDPTQYSMVGEFDFAAIARLKLRVAPSKALAELNVVQDRIAKQAKQGVDLRAELLPLESEIVGPARRGLLFLLAAVGLVFLIVCVNVANLLLARIPGRMREASIRTALGASRGRLVRQMFTESLLLGIVGGTLGVGLASFGVKWFVRAAPFSLPRFDEIAVDVRVLCFGLFLVIFSVTLFGVLPALRMGHADPQQALKSGGTATTENRRARRLRESLIGLEVGLSSLLLILAGLLTASLLQLLRVNVGFTSERILAADVQLPPPNYSQVSPRQHFYDEVLARIRMLPGVISVGWVSKLPLEGEGSIDNITLSDEQHIGADTPLANYRAVSSEYFQAMGIPLLEGRVFAESDRGRNTVVISKSVAERLWPDKKAVGGQCVTGWGGEHHSEIISVVADIRTVRMDEAPTMMVYVPDWYRLPSSASIVVRTAMDPSTVASGIREAVRSSDSDVPILALRPMTQVISESVEARRFQMLLAQLFAASALLLASLGIFGVAAYSVTQRQHELGIRRALGAQAVDVLQLVLLAGMRPVVVGLAGGIAAALAVGHFIRSLLFGIGTADPSTFAIVPIVVITVGLLACYLPARRALRADPMVALRYE